MGALTLLLVAVLGYLLGSFPSGVVVVRFLKGEDLRKLGSGHTGGRNVRRVAGLAPAFAVWYLVFRRHRYRAAAATALTAPASLWVTANPWPVIAVGIGMGVIIAVRHIPNLK